MLKLIVFFTLFTILYNVLEDRKWVLPGLQNPYHHSYRPNYDHHVRVNYLIPIVHGILVSTIICAIIAEKIIPVDEVCRLLEELKRKLKITF